jgi:predicted ATPase/DNA-binding CsgD family transcriptional regulator
VGRTPTGRDGPSALAVATVGGLARAEIRAPVTDLHGRSDEIASLDDLLQRARLVTLVGPGGVGKTRLAIEVAAVAAGRYADGARMCELAPVEPSADVIEAVATGLGVRHRGAAPTVEAVIDWLSPRRALVLFDNCEHVLGAIRPLVREVLARCPDVTLLVTSREALGVDGEWCWLTRPLSVPPGDVANLADAARFDAVTLFAARARAADRDFALTADNAAAVTTICRRLDGIPLALELAAARVPSLGLDDLVAHLDHRFRLLIGSRGAPRQTLRGAVDWSYDLLDDRQQALFRRLAVFPGGWSLDAARAVCVADDFSVLDIVDVLAELVAKSLVSLESTPTGTRYEMLETLRHYGLERLAECNELEDVRRRHARWARAMADDAARGLRGPGEPASGDRLRAELDNLRAAMAWALSAQEPDIAFGIVAALEDYLLLRLDFEVAAWAEQVASVEEWSDQPERYHALGVVAHARWARGDLDEARRLGDDAIAIGRRVGSRPSWAAWQAVGDAAWFKGSADEAVRLFRDWAAEARRLGDEFHLVLALTHLAVASGLADPETGSGAIADEALVLARHCNSPSLIALALYTKSERVIEDDPAAALALAREGAEIGRQSGNRFAYGLCLANAASLTGRIGDRLDALRLYRSAIENWQQSGNWANQRIVLRNLAELAARRDEYGLTGRLVGALGAQGEMLGADIGAEGGRLRSAVDAARRALGDERYAAAVAEGAAAHPVTLVADTLAALDHMLATADTPAAPSRPAMLSPREWEVVELVADGLENQEIARLLFISERTVDTHMSRIRRKLGTTTRTQLAVWGAGQRSRTS